MRATATGREPAVPGPVTRVSATVAVIGRPPAR
jgi:hypothetical protein